MNARTMTLARSITAALTSAALITPMPAAAVPSSSCVASRFRQGTRYSQPHGAMT